VTSTTQTDDISEDVLFAYIVIVEVMNLQSLTANQFRSATNATTVTVQLLPLFAFVLPGFTSHILVI
jgi:hypothetical protein